MAVMPRKSVELAMRRRGACVWGSGGGDSRVTVTAIGSSTLAANGSTGAAFLSDLSTSTAGASALSACTCTAGRAPGRSHNAAAICPHSRPSKQRGDPQKAQRPL
jgi:hypothetical protein